jgi:undecaprenyl-diphosphatase
VLPSAELTIARFDDAVDAAFDHLRGRLVADRLFYTASHLGDWSAIWHIVGAVRIAHDRRNLPNVLGIAAVLGAESLIVNQGIKRLFRRVRPVAHFDHPHQLRRPSTSSFPSGHASAAACAAVLLIDAEPELTALWLALAAVVATSRVHVKIHHATDVLGGAAVGLALGLIGRRLIP